MAKAYSLWIFDRECNPIYHQDWSRIHNPISNSSSNATATTSTSSTSTAASSFFQSNRSSNTTTTTSSNHRRPGETLLPNVSRSVPSLQEVSSSQNATSQDDGLLPLDEEAKLVYGVVFSLRNMVRKLGGGHDHFNSYSTSTYTLSHLLTPTFHTFILFTDPISPPSRLPNSSSSSINGGGGGIPGTAGMSLKGVLLQIWRGPWIENVIKNPLIRGLEREEFEEDEDEFESDEDEDEDDEDQEDEEVEASEQKQKDKSEIRIERRKEERNSGIDSDALRIGIERGSCTTQYLSDDPSPIYTSYSNLHLHLEQQRVLARDYLRSNPNFLSQLSQSEQVINPTNPPPRICSATDSELENLETAYEPQGQGPRIMVVGPEDSGKSTLIKFLANYALRSPAICDIVRKDKGKEKAKTEEDLDGHTGWWPTIVNLDPREGSSPLPCTISSLPLSPLPLSSLSSSTPLNPFGLTPSLTGHLPPSHSVASFVSPLTHWIGKTTPRENFKHSTRVMEWLAENTERRLARDGKARCSGLLIDTPGVTGGDSKNRWEWIRNAVKAFKVNIIVVLSHEKLTIELTRLFSPSGIAVIKLPKSGGVVESDESYRERLAASQVREYFYGSGNSKAKPNPSNDETNDSEMDGSEKKPAMGFDDPITGVPTLSPHSTTLPLDLLEVYKIGQESMAPSSALPIGASRVLSETQLVKLDPVNSTADQSLLLHSVLALIEPPRINQKTDRKAKDSETGATDDEILGAQVLGFIHVANIDVAKGKMTVLSPSVGRLPSKTALLGTLDWQDT